MNPFERIREYRSALLLQIKDTMVKPDDTLTYKEHYRVLLSFLKLLEGDLKNAEYNYVIEKANADNETEYGEQEGITFQSFPLSKDLLLFQPLFANEGGFESANMDSLIEALEVLKRHNRIQEDVLVIPPGVNVLKAVLAESLPCDQEHEDPKPTPMNLDDYEEYGADC